MAKSIPDWGILQVKVSDENGYDFDDSKWQFQQ